MFTPKTLNQHEFLEVRMNRGNGYAYALGEFLGFPQCCIEEFCNASITELQEKHRNKLVNNSLHGTGFVPCMECLKKDANEIIATINTNRIFPHPFPYKKAIFGTEQIKELFNNFLEQKGIASFFKN